jgi:GNAT superfamily N-acetyltransferase
MSYEIELWNYGWGPENYKQLEHLYRRHYAETCERLEKEGIPCSPYNPRLDEYQRASKGGWLLTFVLLFEREPIGHCNVYVTNDMHNQDLIAQEDTIYVLPEHRNGVGKKLIQAVHGELIKRGVKRLNITTPTDLRVSKLLGRIGYKHAAHAMTITF